MWPSVLILVVATASVIVVGPRLAHVAEDLADRTGLGQVLFGAVFIGASTSLPGIVLTVSAGLRGRTELAVGNALGGVVAQTTFIALADIAFRERALSRGVPTVPVAAQGASLLVLLSLLLVGVASADTAVGAIHPVSPVLLVVYVIALATLRGLGGEGALGGARGKKGRVEADDETPPDRVPPKRPRSDDADGGGDREATGRLWLRFGGSCALLVVAGLVLSLAGGEIADESALSDIAVGALLTGVATSMPELVTAIAAARSGAVGLAAGDIIGGNSFDVLFIAAADVATPEPVFGAFTDDHVLLLAAAMLFNSVLLGGLVRRRATGSIDRESAAILLGYGGLVVWLLAG